MAITLIIKIFKVKRLQSSQIKKTDLNMNFTKQEELFKNVCWILKLNKKLIYSQINHYKAQKNV